MSGQQPTEAEVLATYPEGRIVKMSNGAIRVEGILDDPAAPMRGRATFTMPPDERSAPVQSLAAMTLKGRPIRYVDLMPWEVPAPKPPSASSLRHQEEEEARRRAYDDWNPDRRPPEEPQGPGPAEMEAAVLHAARKNAEVVAGKWMGGQR